PVMCEVYCPTARKPPALAAPATRASTAPRRTLVRGVRTTSAQPRINGNMVAPTLATACAALPPEGAELARGGPSLRSWLAHAHAGRGGQKIDAGAGFFVRVAGGQHHAFAHAELHLARRQVRHHHGKLADQIFGLVGAGDAAEDVAGYPLADIQRQSQQFGRARHRFAMNDLGDAQVDLREVVDTDRGCDFFAAGRYRFRS